MSEAHQRVGTGALVRKIVSQAELLAKKEIELAKTELRADLRLEARVAQGLGIAAVAALVTVNLLLFTAALALSLVMPGWAAGLIVSGVMLVVALLFAVVSWRRRLRDPMAHTRRTLSDGVKWTKERFA
ncbi:MAG TPA: phage holin family protein [Polyangia bacterium]|nr:phage holin family protein [Polyangia bacterium]